MNKGSMYLGDSPRRVFVFSVLVVSLFSSVWGVAHADMRYVKANPVASGGLNQWVATGLLPRYTTVDEDVCNGNTDYVYSNTVNNRQSFTVGLQNVPNGATIKTVLLTPCLSRHSSTTAGESVMKVFYRLNGTSSADYGNYRAFGTTPGQYGPTVISGLNIVKTATTQFEIGTVYASGNRGLRLSKYYANIGYEKTPLIIPSPVVGVNDTGTQNTVTWTDPNTVESGYYVQRSENGGVYTTVASTTTNGTNYVDTTASSGNSYVYRVQAFETHPDTGMVDNLSGYGTSNEVIVP